MSDPVNDLLGEEEVAIEATLNGRPLKRRVKARQHLAESSRSFKPSSSRATPRNAGSAHPACCGRLTN
jgi:hypothetical protein